MNMFSLRRAPISSCWFLMVSSRSPVDKAPVWLGKLRQAVIDLAHEFFLSIRFHAMPHGAGPALAHSVTPLSGTSGAFPQSSEIRCAYNPGALRGFDGLRDAPCQAC